MNDTNVMHGMSKESNTIWVLRVEDVDGGDAAC